MVDDSLPWILDGSRLAKSIDVGGGRVVLSSLGHGQYEICCVGLVIKARKIDGASVELLVALPTPKP